MAGDRRIDRAPQALPSNADQSGRRLRAARKLPGDPVGPLRLAEPVRRRRGGVEFVAPAGAYAGLPAWRTRTGWLLSLRTHPDLVTACAGLVRPSLFVGIMRELSRYAAADTGRGIAVPHGQVAAACGVCTKTVQRAVRIAYSLGALHLVLPGAQMSLAQRCAVLDAYGRGIPSRRWRELPNFYAAVMPAAAVARVAVDNPTAEHDHCPPSGTGGPAGSGSSVVRGESPFTSRCGQPERARAGPSGAGSAQSTRPAGAAHPRSADRPRPAGATQQREEPARRGGPVLSPELEAYAAALCALLPGYRRVSLRRIGPGLRCYLTAGLSPAQLAAGLNRYCTSHGLTWLTTWPTDAGEAQARYLIGMLTHANGTGFLPPSRRR